MSNSILPALKILGVKINTLSYQDCFKLIELFLLGDSTKIILTPNPEIILAAQKNKDLFKYLNEADLSLPDGAGLIFASKYRIKNRVTGTDIMQNILKKYPAKKYKFILKEGGLTSEQELKEKVHVALDEVSPDIIFVGLGCPDQEKWIADNKIKYPSAKIIMAVGGGIDFLSGKQRRAPTILRRIGLEWLYRLFRQPKRIIRIFKATILFPLKVFIS